MTEAHKRIAEYKEQLPHLKEKIIAVALMFAMGLAMMTTATFAWLTLSDAPSVTGVKTAIAANGNLEIALVGEEGAIPAASAVGDGGKGLVERNITWGNLINLSDPQYGLSNLVLRPAMLNTAGLRTNPLYGADYTDDGRVEKVNSNFSYTKWVEPDGDIPGYFAAVTDYYGVKAISSTKIEAVGADITYYNMLDDANEKNLAAGSAYVALANNGAYMPSLATLMGVYMTARMNPSDANLSNPTVAIEDVRNIRDMYEAFLVAFDREAEAIAALANLQLFLEIGEGFTPCTSEMVYAATNDTLTVKDGETVVTVKITDLKQFINDRNTIASDWDKLKTLADGGTDVTWKDSGMNTIVNNLVDVGKCTIGADNTPISSIGASNAMGYLSGTQEAKITNGILYRFEERTGAYIEVKNLSISATVKRSGITIPATVKANISTTAPREYNLFNNDLATVKALNTGEYVGGEVVANDTYGLAIDLWVRTNAEGSYLVLEGNVLTQTESKRATGLDAKGETVELWTLTRNIEISEEGTEKTSTVAVSYDLYQVEGEDGSVTWYDASTYAQITLEDGEKPIAKMVEVTIVVGYEGVDRVWGDKATTDANGISTTQGGGSCYTFYYNAPDDRDRTLKLLASMKVVFYGDNGGIMATAEMDTEHYYETPGKVIVPLVLSERDSVYLGEDTQGNATYAITALEKNIATRVTALVYLDGTTLTNEDVLASNDIQGHLNIQFGSTADLSSLDNEKLETSELTLSATLDKTEFNYDTATDKMITNVVVNVGGVEPSTVRAHFVRQITTNQGVRGETFTLTDEDKNGTWTYDYEFTTPGTYLLRSVEIDGIEYELPTAQTVTVEGFTIKSITWGYSANNTTTILTADNLTETDMWLEFAADKTEKMPKTVSGRFLRDDGTVVSVAFTLNPTTQLWSGKATFRSSGTYTLEYLVLDNEYVEVDEGMKKVANVTLGIQAKVRTTAMADFDDVAYSGGVLTYTYDPSLETPRMFKMQVELLDDTGEELLGLDARYETMTLAYRQTGGTATMNTALTWKATESCYEGEFPIEKAGIFTYSQVLIGSDNVISKAVEAPTLTIISPEPPAYVTKETAEKQFYPVAISSSEISSTYNGTATMNVSLSNAESATVRAKIVHYQDEYKTPTNEEFWVLGTQESTTYTDDGTPITTFVFKVPYSTYHNSSTATQDGYWQLETISLSNVYDDNGVYYVESDQNDPNDLLKMDMTDKGNRTRVVGSVQISFNDDNDLIQDFGKEGDVVTATFMTSYDVSGMKVTLKDFEGKSIVDYLDNSKEVTLRYTYGGESVLYGGYSGEFVNTAMANTVDIVLQTTDDTQTIFTQSDSVTLSLAGTYTPTLSFTTNNQVTYSVQADGVKNMPKFTVSSVTPTVTITEVSPDTSTSFPTRITWEKKGKWLYSLEYTLTDNKTNVLDTANNTVTVYAKATTDGEGTGDAEFVRPTLTFTAGGIDSSDKVTFTIPKGSSNTDISVSLTGTTSKTVTLGSTYNVHSLKSLITYTVYGYRGHGDQTINTVTITRNGVAYTVTLEKPIVIHNPSSVDKTS